MSATIIPTAAPAVAAPPSPWWSSPIFHLVTGGLVLAASIVLFHYGQVAEGDAAIGSGITFLGVGAGASASS